MQRLQQQLDFIIELDKLKSVIRRSPLINGQRHENSAEHSWHIALMAFVLAEHSQEPIDVLRTIKMLLVHDIIEIDAGDTYCYDDEGYKDKIERERRAADRLFGALPADQAGTLRALWDEFEAGVTPEAKFAQAMDRLMPMLHNFHAQGRVWQANGVVYDQVLERAQPIIESSGTLGAYIRSLLDQAVAAGYLAAR
ncbi:MAG TPA: HD domain-containing protein [Anaerolineae bacterium]|nr:HD domain-containing protein [Anaerolineae bacterium]HMR64031.1 HD domain-containing protein [Anaerolineae bacterium]